MFRSKQPPTGSPLIAHLMSFPQGNDIIKKKSKAVDELVAFMSFDPSDQLVRCIMCFYGQVDGILVATTKRLVFIGQSGGLRVDDIPYHAIHSVGYDLDLIFGNIFIRTYGQTVIWEKIDKPVARDFGHQLRLLVDGYRYASR